MHWKRPDGCQGHVFQVPSHVFWTINDALNRLLGTRPTEARGVVCRTRGASTAARRVSTDGNGKPRHPHQHSREDDAQAFYPPEHPRTSRRKACVNLSSSFLYQPLQPSPEAIFCLGRTCPTRDILRRYCVASTRWGAFDPRASMAFGQMRRMLSTSGG